METLRLIRVGNCLLTMAAVWLGAYMTWLEPVYLTPTLASVAAFLVCGAGNAINDAVDVEIDRVNKAHRVLVRGGLSVRYAVWLAIILTVLAIGVGAVVNLEVLIVVVVACGLLVAYNLYLKRIPLVGNFVVALLGAMTFVTGGLAIHTTWAWELPGPLIPAAFALFLHIVREIIKDAEDIEADRSAGVCTLPQVVGVRSALMIALGLLFVLILLTYVPVFFGWFGRGYEIIAIYIIDLPMLLLLILIWGNPTQKMLKIGSLALKFSMISGVIALLIG
ncbi:MAG: geranylgeranylglycerol-phosphate geranylgeranyltransferase [candidate division Zixibacteria bacterium]|nr:geranylgeranylglycerol-phosphate geranylgeranyltransferase [candidate division Zixibacteria bacterium]